MRGVGESQPFLPLVQRWTRATERQRPQNKDQQVSLSDWIFFLTFSFVRTERFENSPIPGRWLHASSNTCCTYYNGFWYAALFWWHWATSQLCFSTKLDFNLLFLWLLFVSFHSSTDSKRAGKFYCRLKFSLNTMPTCPYANWESHRAVITPPLHTGPEVLPSSKGHTVRDEGQNPHSSFCVKMHFKVQSEPISGFRSLRSPCQVSIWQSFNHLSTKCLIMFHAVALASHARGICPRSLM